MNKSPWYREPLFHFIIIGIVLFGAYAVFNKSEEPTENKQAVSHGIKVTKYTLRELSSQFKAAQGRPPSDAELATLSSQWVRDEVMYREGLAAGLDKNDPVIRQRIAKLMEYVLGGAGSSAEPSDQELRQYFEVNKGSYKSSSVLAFEQIFLSTSKHGPAAEGDARKLLGIMESGSQNGTEMALDHGDSMGGDIAVEEMQQGLPEALATKFGAPFIASVQKLEIGKWSGPLQSSDGWHVVRRITPTAPTFDELRAQIRNDVLAKKGGTAPEDVYNKILKNYQVERDPASEVKK